MNHKAIRFFLGIGLSFLVCAGSVYAAETDNAVQIEEDVEEVQEAVPADEEAAAEEAPVLPQTVRVGWYERAGYFEEDRDGELYGFGMDYLNALASQTGWKYEFVKGTRQECLRWLERGEIDLLSPVSANTELTNAVMSRENIGEEFGYIYKLGNNFTIDYGQPEEFQMITLGMLAGSPIRENLQRYCQEKEFDFYEIIEYPGLEDMRKDLADGKLDAIVMDSYVNVENLKVIGRFSNGQMGFACSNEVLLPILNEAMESIKLDNPSFTEELRALYFAEGSQNQLEYTEAERQYLAEDLTYAVVVPSNQYPIGYTSGEEHKGIVLDILQKMEYSTGISFWIEYADTFEDARAMLEAGEAEMLAGVVVSKQDINSFVQNQNGGETLGEYTSAFYETQMAFIGRKNVNLEDSLKVAVPMYCEPAIRQLALLYPRYQFSIYGTDDECVNAVLSGETDIAIQMDLKVNELMLYEQYKELQNLKYVQGDYAVTFWMNSNDEFLTEVVNKSIQGISASTMSAIVNDNIRHISMQGITLEEFWSLYKYYLILGFLGLVALGYALFSVRKFKKEQADKEKAYHDTIAEVSSMQKFQIDTAPIIRSRDKTQYYAVVVDVDKFKVVNDLFGYEQGDRVIWFVGRILKSELKENDLITRSVADKFIIFKYADKDEEVIRYLRRVYETVDKILEDTHEHYRMLLKAGIYRIMEEDTNLSSIIDKASIAKKNIQKLHKSTYEFYDDSLRQKKIEAKMLENEMQEALDTRQFCIFLQPQIDLVSKRIVSAEALVRWIHPERGLIPPYKFIPVFEENGFIVQLDMFVWEEAIKTIARWRDSGQIMVPIAINLSRIDVQRDGMVDDLIGLMKKYDVDCKWIKTELTESVCVDDDELVMESMRRLKEFGFKIAVDDFGSGYSSLHLLKKMPIDILKIDKSFLDINMDMQFKDEVVIRDVIDMGKHLKMQIIMEGVETIEQSDFLEAAGCDVVQGYYYGRPMPIGQFEKAVAESYQATGGQ